MIDDSPYWTKQRREIVGWLEDHAPSFTHGYVGAVHLLYNQAFPGRIHFICHVIRDIYRYLPETLGARTLSRPSEVFPSMVEALVKKWDQYPTMTQPETTKGNSDVPLSVQVYKYMLKIINKSKEMAVQPRVGEQFAIYLFRSIERRLNEQIPPWVIKAFDLEYDFFVKRAHLARSIDRVPTEEGLVEHFEAFERAFHSIIGRYFTGKDELDAILRETNKTTD